MCEKDPMTCHRSILISEIAWAISAHIIDHEIIETQVNLEKRLIAQLKLHPDMFKDTHNT